MTVAKHKWSNIYVMSNECMAGMYYYITTSDLCRYEIAEETTAAKGLPELFSVCISAMCLEPEKILKKLELLMWSEPNDGFYVSPLAKIFLHLRAISYTDDADVVDIMVTECGAEKLIWENFDAEVDMR